MDPAIQVFPQGKATFENQVFPLGENQGETIFQVFPQGLPRFSPRFSPRGKPGTFWEQACSDPRPITVCLSKPGFPRFSPRFSPRVAAIQVFP